MYKYETHLHTFPVSKCARFSVRENLEFYKSLGYSGVFITNHFIDGNINYDKSAPYEKIINFYFSDYEEAKNLSAEIGIEVFLGIELSYRGTDFLVYGLDKEWFLSHPEIAGMKKTEQLPFFMKSGALVIQAHPFREASYIDHLRLFPRCVHGVEILNACRSDFENAMAKQYAKNYNLLKFAGTDNHVAAEIPRCSGMEFKEPIANEKDFVEKIKSGLGRIFLINRE